MKRLAIDPGDVHVGWAKELSGRKVLTGEWRPTQACDELVWLMTRNAIEEVIVEEYVLYPGKSQDQHWSPMQTSQLIGAIKLIAYWFRIPLVEQGAYIKTPTRAQLRGRGIRQVGKGIHQLDAELHLYHRMIRGGSK